MSLNIIMYLGSSWKRIFSMIRVGPKQKAFFINLCICTFLYWPLSYPCRSLEPKLTLLCYPYYVIMLSNRQPTLWLQHLCLEVLTMHYISWPILRHGIPPTLLKMRFWHSSSRTSLVMKQCWDECTTCVPKVAG